MSCFCRSIFQNTAKAPHVFQVSSLVQIKEINYVKDWKTCINLIKIKFVYCTVSLSTQKTGLLKFTVMYMSLWVKVLQWQLFTATIETKKMFTMSVALGFPFSIMHIYCSKFRMYLWLCSCGVSYNRNWKSCMLEEGCFVVYFCIELSFLSLSTC